MFEQILQMVKEHMAENPQVAAQIPPEQAEAVHQEIATHLTNGLQNQTATAGLGGAGDAGNGLLGAGGGGLGGALSGIGGGGNDPVAIHRQVSGDRGWQGRGYLRSSFLSTSASRASR